MKKSSTKNKPPRLGEWLLESFCSYDFVSTALWDLEEIYHSNLEEKGRFKADFLYIKEALGVVFYLYFKGESRYSLNTVAALKNNITFALRSFKKRKSYALLNVLGISSGLIIFLLIMLYTSYELSYDAYHDRSERIYRVFKSVNGLEEEYLDNGTPAPLAAALLNEFPEVESAARFINYRNILMEAGGETFLEPRVYAVDPAVFKVFSFKLVSGDLETINAEKSSVAISESTALKYFGRTDVLNEVIRFRDRLPLKVSGVFKDMPANSHFTMHVIVNFEGLMEAFQQNLTNWNNNPFETFLLLKEGTDPYLLEAKLPMVREKFADDPQDEDGQAYTYFLQPLTDIHFNQKIHAGRIPVVDKSRLYFFMTIAFAVLVMAGINYVNLATASAMVRMKETGIRKVMGAGKKSLVLQFLVESGLLIFFSLALAVLVAELLLPAFSEFVNRPLSFDFASPLLWLTLMGTGVLLTILSGIYPAIMATSFDPLRSISGKMSATPRSYLRNALVVFQFALSTGLIIGAIVVARQLYFIDNLDTGYTRDQVIILSTRDDAVDNRLSAYMDELSKVTGVAAVATSWSLPTNVTSNTEANWPGIEDAQRLPMFMVGVTYDFFQLYEIALVEGRFFDPDISTDEGAIMLNETAVKALGWKNPLGREMITQEGKKGRVIGVVKDFHMKSLRQEIEPLQILLDKRYATLSVRVNGDMNSTLVALEKVYESFNPSYPFEYRFFEDIYDSAYEDDRRTGQLILWLTALAIVIACLGLYGLASHKAEGRIKELGIRKVMGASAFSIAGLLFKDFLVLLFAAFLMAIPLSYYFINDWLNGFAYHVNLNAATFLVTAAILLVMVLLAISYHTWRAATSNPVLALRTE